MPNVRRQPLVALLFATLASLGACDEVVDVPCDAASDAADTDGGTGCGEAVSVCNAPPCAPGFSADLSACCAACSPGDYCAGDDAPATQCDAGTWDDDHNPATPCVPHTECVDGAVTQVGTPTQDAHCANWRTQFGTDATDDIIRVLVDDTDHIYAVGGTRGSFRGHYNTQGTPDITLTKLSPSGEILWHQQYESLAPVIPHDAVIAPNGDIYIGGSVDGSLPGHTGIGGTDALLIRLTPDGEVVWMRFWGTEFDDAVSGLAFDETGALYAAGIVKLIEDWTWAGAGFIRRLDPDTGEETWTHQFQDNDRDACLAIDVGPDGNIYCAGYTVTRTYGDSSRWFDGLIVAVSPAGEQVRRIEFGNSDVTEQFTAILVEETLIHVGGFLFAAGPWGASDTLFHQWGMEDETPISRREWNQGAFEQAKFITRINGQLYAAGSGRPREQNLWTGFIYRVGANEASDALVTSPLASDFDEVWHLAPHGANGMLIGGAVHVGVAGDVGINDMVVQRIAL